MSNPIPPNNDKKTLDEFDDLLQANPVTTMEIKVGRNELAIDTLGPARLNSPLNGVEFVEESERILIMSRLEKVKESLARHEDPPAFELAGPRQKIFHDPKWLKAAIVTCGGLCPGLNDVIRSIVNTLTYIYGVKTIYGIQFGYAGLDPAAGYAPMELTPAKVARIHETGGTILGSSRGNRDASVMVETLERMDIGVLFCIGGDGTLRGAHSIVEEIRKRKLHIGVIGVPKTIDNDINYVEKTFGFDTAVGLAAPIISSAHVEAEGAPNGVGLVKLMGRDSGFIAAHATLAYPDVNFCLIPEVPFNLDRFLMALKKRLISRQHAVVVVAEGAGQEFFRDTAGTDASGNKLHQDIGIFLKEKIGEFSKKEKFPISLKYIDPSYIIRSSRSCATDSVFCLQLAQNAVHAAMAGKNDMVVGLWNAHFTHVPISVATSERKKLLPKGVLWRTVLHSTGQKGVFEE